VRPVAAVVSPGQSAAVVARLAGLMVQAVARRLPERALLAARLAAVLVAQRAVAARLEPQPMVVGQRLAWSATRHNFRRIRWSRRCRFRTPDT
jgi:hypothetical protein